jgi:hypothetical protein
MRTKLAVTVAGGALVLALGAAAAAAASPGGPASAGVRQAHTAQAIVDYGLAPPVVDD